MATNNLSIIRGDDKYYNLTFTDGTGSAIDITNWTIYFTVKSNLSDTDDSNALIQKDVSSHTDPTNGKTRVHLTHGDTDLTKGDYYYDIQVKKDNGDIITVVNGIFEVAYDVTRRTT